eukprot:5017888-Pyramimonas_sp.AAC.1
MELVADQPTQAANAATKLLHIAAAQGHEEVVRLLVELGGDTRNGVTAEAVTPLHRAAGAGHANVVRLLVELGGDPRAQTAEGSTPMHAAA